jgi:hypothetical protein
MGERFILKALQMSHNGMSCATRISICRWMHFVQALRVGGGAGTSKCSYPIKPGQPGNHEVRHE